MSDEVKTGEEVKEPAAEVQQKPDETRKEERSVPLHVLQSMRDELKNSRAEVEKLRQRFNGKEDAPAPRQETPKTQEQDKDPLSGMDDGELVSVADVKRILAANQSRGVQLSGRLEHMQFAIDHPDYKEKISGLGEFLKHDPELAQTIQSEIKNSRNPLATAYNYAKLVSKGDTKKSKSNEVDIMADLERILENQEKPKSPASVQGNGGGSVSGAERIMAMSTEEFDKHVDDLINGNR